MTETANILIVEDEAHLARGMLFNLRAEGYSVQLAMDGEKALEIVRTATPRIDAMILDIMLPGRDGFSVAAELREERNYLPILMLTARSRPEDVLRGFDAGADDYLAKPFDLSVLLARLNSLLRRMGWQRRSPAEPTAKRTSEQTADGEASSPFTFAGRTIDFESLELTGPHKTVGLTLMESDLLRYLVSHQGQVVSRKELLEQVWHVHEDTDTRAIDNFIVRLRRYLEEDPAHPVFLETVRGVGYRFLPATGSRSETSQEGS